MWTSNLRISQKLPLLIIVASLVLGIGMGIAGYLAASSAVEDEVQKKLQVALQGKRTGLEDYLASVRDDLTISSKNPTIVKAVKAFARSWNVIPGDKKAALQKAYVTDNRFPVGEKHNLDFADDGTSYSTQHKNYHPWLRRFLNTREYYDIFIFDLQGNLIYSVFKELDYATNLVTGKWNESGLADVFKGANAGNSADHQFFVDFAPYAPSSDAPASFIGAPIYDGDRKVGVLAFQMSISRLNKLMQESSGLGESGESYIVGSDYLMRSDSRFSEESTILERKVETEPVTAALAGNEGVITAQDYRDVTVKSVYSPFNFMGTKWAILAEIDEDEYLQPIAAMRNSMTLTALVLLLIVGATGYYFANKIAQALGQATAIMKTLAGGDLTVDIPPATSADEIGEMVTALGIFKEGAIAQKRLEKETAEAAEKEAEHQREADAQKAAQLEAERQREQQVAAAEAERAAKITELVHAFEENTTSMLSTLTGAATELQSTANGLVTTAESTQSLSTVVASASQEASTNVQTVASAAEELSASIGEISRQINQTSTVSENAVAEAENSTKSVAELAESARKISEVVDMISDIAEQTNLLALNATIEAARAGDAGKGFAVVASEVKSLANQTAKATEEIASQINGMQNATDGAVTAIDNIGSVIHQIREATVSISSAINQQNAATGEISRNVQEASTGTNEVSMNIQDVSNQSEETGQAASQVLSASGSLDTLAKNLSSDIEDFLTKIRAV